jgi:hypothetical protein
VLPNPRMQPTSWRGAAPRSGGTLRVCHYGGVGLCGREHESPQLMRKSLGGHTEFMRFDKGQLLDASGC